MQIDLSELSRNQVYYTFIQTLIPRPVAWVLSDNGNDSYNLAPFSYFSGVSSNPPTLMLSVGLKPDGTRKDTWVNIAEREDFVVHIAHRELATHVTATSAGLQHGESELDAQGLETVDFPGSRIPRLKVARIAYACEKYEIHEVGETPQGLIIGRVKQLYIDDAVGQSVDGKLTVDPKKVDPIARIGGNDYALFGETITVPRPK